MTPRAAMMSSTVLATSGRGENLRGRGGMASHHHRPRGGPARQRGQGWEPRGGQTGGGHTASCKRRGAAQQPRGRLAQAACAELAAGGLGANDRQRRRQRRRQPALRCDSPVILLALDAHDRVHGSTGQHFHCNACHQARPLSSLQARVTAGIQHLLRDSKVQLIAVRGVPAASIARGAGAASHAAPARVGVCVSAASSTARGAAGPAPPGAPPPPRLQDRTSCSRCQAAAGSPLPAMHLLLQRLYFGHACGWGGGGVAGSGGRASGRRYANSDPRRQLHTRCAMWCAAASRRRHLLPGMRRHP